ncbi:zinc metalloproteinase nas-14-like isoform X2 [Mytilus trossulus]|uniref:zinc metalloproteinase nas-14-like isoform X2 n=1 Tax=Mytilus trossulus TaxID=6551 RepID=UPI003006EFFE
MLIHTSTMGVLTTLVSVLVILVPTATSLSCVDQTCDSTHVCKLQFHQGVLAHNHCDKLHAHGHHPKCSDPFPADDHCHCDDEACMNRLYALMTTAVTIDMTTADPMVNPTAAPTQSAITTQASVVTTTAQPPFTTKVPQTSQPVVTTMAPMATTTMAPVTMAPTTQALVCMDQDKRCNDAIYQQILCQSVDNRDYAIRTCPKSCNLCDEFFALKSSTTPVPVVTTTELPTTTSFQCVDHETKCSDTFYLSILCKATDQPSKDYALATCPKACNLCGSVGSLDPAFG